MATRTPKRRALAKKKNPHWGSTLDAFLGEEGTREAFQAVAIKEVLAWQIGEAMKAQKISQKRMAEKMKTSRSQISRLLDPNNGNVDDRHAATGGRPARPHGHPRLS